MLSTFSRLGTRQGIKLFSCQQLKHQTTVPVCVQSVFTKQTERCCSSKSTENPNQVYYGTLTPQIRLVKIFSLSSSVAGLIFQPMLYKQLETMPALPVVSSYLLTIFKSHSCLLHASQMTYP